MQTPSQEIHIKWQGPYPYSEASKLTESGDYGVYQIYGAHMTYGSDVLLYIGRAERQTFGQRLPQEQWWLDHHDAGRLRIYVGRIAGKFTPSDEIWNLQIILAERLLIFSHSPAYNTQKNLGGLDADLHHVHVFNWGCYCDLLPEVSGTRWTGKLGPLSDYRHFKTDDPRQ